MEKAVDDLKIICSEQVNAATAADPELAAALREMFAAFHQAYAGMLSGQYPDFETGVEALTGRRPILLDPDGSDDPDD